MTISMAVPAEAWDAVALKKPLVFHLTNGVVMNEQAHLALALGASPLMSAHPGEAGELTDIADGLLLNIGTPTDASAECMRCAAARAAVRGIPVVLDPVGYGASKLRNGLVEELLDTGAVGLVKGNGGEMGLLGGSGGQVRGVDSRSCPDPARSVLSVARSRHCLAVSTGVVDHVSDGERVWAVSGGSDLLPRITGSGCWLGTVLTACLAAGDDAVSAVLAGLVAFGLAAERAEKLSRGPASFRTHLLDELYLLKGSDLASAGGRVKEEEVGHDGRP